MRSPVRTLAVVCPDWPLLAAGRAGVPAVVVQAGRIVACSVAARAEGVRVGQRRREAEGLAGSLEVVKCDPALEARMFEPVVSAIATLTPRVEVTTPGTCSFPTRGPARYFGGEEALAGKVAALVDEVLAGMPGVVGGVVGRSGDEPRGVVVPTRHITPRGHDVCRVGVADGPFAAVLAATGGGAAQVTIVERGRDRSRKFLSSFPLGVLGLADLSDLLSRLGIHRLGQLAEMPEEAVTARLGAEGRRAWYLANGLEDRALVLADPPPDLVVRREIEPPAERIDAVAFTAAASADELCRRLGELELACTRLRIEVETEHGESSCRLWRADAPLTARMMVDRVRWQLEGWQAGTSESEEPTAGVAVLSLAADEVVKHRGRQLGFWGEVSESDIRARRGLARLQGVLGHEAVTTAVVAGGRSMAEQVHRVPLGDAREGREAREEGGRRSTGARSQAAVPPWPGRIPPPSPLVVFGEPLPVRVLDASESDVRVSGRGLPSAAPAQLVLGTSGTTGRAIVSWAGPWPVDERWWDPSASHRRARFQVVTDRGGAYLLALEGGTWWAEALYD
jgi:protein ImuB